MNVPQPPEMRKADVPLTPEQVDHNRRLLERYPGLGLPTIRVTVRRCPPHVDHCAEGKRRGEIHAHREDDLPCGWWSGTEGSDDVCPCHGDSFLYTMVEQVFVSDDREVLVGDIFNS